jgi:hypothetical protein
MIHTRLVKCSWKTIIACHVALDVDDTLPVRGPLTAISAPIGLATRRPE